MANAQPKNEEPAESDEKLLEDSGVPELFLLLPTPLLLRPLLPVLGRLEAELSLVVLVWWHAPRARSRLVVPVARSLPWWPVVAPLLRVAQSSPFPLAREPVLPLRVFGAPEGQEDEPPPLVRARLLAPFAVALPALVWPPVLSTVLELPREQRSAVRPPWLLHPAEQVPRWLQLRVVLRLLLWVVVSSPRTVPQVGQPVGPVLRPVASRLLLLVPVWLLLAPLVALLLVSVLPPVLRHMEGARLGGPLLRPLLWPLLRRLLRTRLVLSLAWRLLRPPLRARRTLPLSPHWPVTPLLLRIPVDRTSLVVAWVHLVLGPEPLAVLERQLPLQYRAVQALPHQAVLPDGPQPV